MITREGSMAVILSPDRRQVLLHRRELFRLWDLPGGGIEKNETPEQAIIRETREETGYEIQLEQLVGVYLCQSVNGLGDQKTYVFRARATGGEARPSGLETSDLCWCDLTEAPRRLEPLHRQMVDDAILQAPEPFQRRIDFPLWKLYPARLAFAVVSVRNAIVRRLA